MGGLLEARHLALAAALAPLVLVGVWLAGPLARRTERAPIRPLALGLAGFAALLLLARTAFGG